MCLLYFHLQIYDTEFDGVGVRVYEPVKVGGSKRPVLMYYHGGGWSWLSVGKSSTIRSGVRRQQFE